MMAQPAWNPGQPSRRPGGRREAKSAHIRERAQRREARWQANRLAVPYRTDGPRVTFGIIWFALLLMTAFTSPVMVALLAAAVASLAGLQTAHAWFPELGSAGWWAAAAAFTAGIGGFLGPLGLVAGTGISLAICLMYGVAFPVRRLTVGQLVGAVIRAAVPVGLAAGCLAALGRFGPGSLLTLVLMVSAYEAGDFVVGSGSSNAVEGPVSGVVALSAVVFILWILVPKPFDQQGIVLFGLMTALSCPLGQIAASALLPHGAAWAPALRRLDSYLIAAPLWLLLLEVTNVAAKT